MARNLNVEQHIKNEDSFILKRIVRLHHASVNDF